MEFRRLTLLCHESDLLVCLFANQMSTIFAFARRFTYAKTAIEFRLSVLSASALRPYFINQFSGTCLLPFHTKYM